MSVTLEMGLWLTISGPTNSGVPYLQYCGSSGVSFCALPKSQIRTCSLLESAIRRFSGYRTARDGGELGRRQGLTPGKGCAGACPCGCGAGGAGEPHTHFDVQVQDSVLVQIADALQDLPHVGSDLRESRGRVGALSVGHATLALCRGCSPLCSLIQ